MKDLTKVKCDVPSCQAPVQTTPAGYTYSRCTFHRMVSGEKGKSIDANITCSIENCQQEVIVNTDKFEYHHIDATGMPFREAIQIPKGIGRSVILKKPHAEEQYKDDSIYQKIKSEKNIERLRMFVLQSYVEDSAYFSFIYKKAMKEAKRERLSREIDQLKKQIEQKEREYNEVV